MKIRKKTLGYSFNVLIVNLQYLHSMDKVKDNFSTLSNEYQQIYTLPFSITSL